MIKKRVLIVDDEEDLTWTLNKKLSKDKHLFELLIASNGREALELLSQVPIDVVVSDIRMPEVGGLELLMEIKKKYPQTKVIIMTAYSSPEQRSKAIQAGCLYYIEKPFEINELRAMILDALNEREGFRGTVSDFQLPDIIQLNCLGRLTSALIIRHEGEEGIIYFKNGDIVHAETRDLEGENAFYQMMSWKGGEFSVKRMMKPPKETIFKSWQNLLLEGLRIADETSDMAQEEKENEKKRRLLLLKNELDRFLKISDMRGAFLYTRGGFPVTSSVKEETLAERVDELGSKTEELIRLLEQAFVEWDSGDLINFVGNYQNMILFLTLLPEKTDYLILLADAGVNEAKVRLELRMRLQTLQKILKS